LAQVTEEQRPHVEDMVEDRHPVLEVSEGGEAEALHEDVDCQLADHFLQKTGSIPTPCQEVCDTIECFLQGGLKTPVMDLVVERNKEIEHDNQLDGRLDPMLDCLHHNPDILELDQIFSSR